MIIKELNFTGEFKSKTRTGKVNYYSEGDVVNHKNETYIALTSIDGKSPYLGESVGWTCISKKQVFYETTESPIIAKVGDEWFNTITGVSYKRVSDINGEHWVEL
tara:strand:- start:4374 stop:4688 length:315 start_codon:yes stop_codon:yes gene_type:complete